MSSRRSELSEIISSYNSISFDYWVTLLNFFEQYHIELDIIDVRLLVTECERCRVELNQIIRDKIRKEDTNPDVYTHLRNLEAKLEITQEVHKEESTPLPMVVMASQ